MNPYRQGDVVLVPVAGVPATATVVPRSGQKTILAYGEVTGHHHRFESAAATMLRDESGREFVQIADADVLLRPVAVEDAIKRDVRMENGQIVRFDATDFAAAQAALSAASTLTLRGDILVHEEHHAIVVAPGVYELPGQREYTSADMPAIRVAD